MKTDKIEEQIKDPIVMKRIIDMILDPKNPDSSKINKQIIKNISDCIVKDDAFLTTIKGIVIENSQKITQQIVQKCLDDSKELLTNALVTTINLRCEEYLKEQRRVVSNILKKTVDKCVDEILKTTKQNIDKNTAKLSKNSNKNSASNDESINVPFKYKNEVENYIQFLRSKG